MKIFDIYIKNFRKFKDFDISFSDKFLIKGPTGSGKTSIVESCYLSISGKSFRTSHLKEMIRSDSTSLFTKCSIEDINGYRRELTSGTDRSGIRKITIDGMSSSRKELINIVTSVVHTPDDMEIIDGVPSKRRDFIDKAAFIQEKDYYDDLVNYSRYIKQKAASLKKKNIRSVKYLNEAAIPLIKKIREKRMDICLRINNEFLETIEKMFPGLVFEISSFMDENTGEKLSSKLEKELEKGYPLYGPHLDPVNVRYQVGESKNMSMGEKYLVSVILKISELYLHAKTGIYPLFFMDDAFVFLDDRNKKMLLNTVMDLKNQTIMTASVEIPEKLDNLNVYRLV
jgi:DNA replication and repair protein RecF